METQEEQVRRDGHGRITYNDDPNKVTFLMRHYNLLYEVDLFANPEKNPNTRIQYGDNSLIVSPSVYDITNTKITDFTGEEDIEQAITNYLNSLTTTQITIESEDIQDIYYVYGGGKQYFSVGKVLNQGYSSVNWINGTLFETNNRVSLNVGTVGYGDGIIPVIALNFYPPEDGQPIETGVFTIVGMETHEKIPGGSKYFLIRIHVVEQPTNLISVDSNAKLSLSKTTNNGYYTLQCTAAPNDTFSFDDYVLYLINGEDLDNLRPYEAAITYIPYVVIHIAELTEPSYFFIVYRGINWFNKDENDNNVKNFSNIPVTGFYINPST